MLTAFAVYLAAHFLVYALLLHHLVPFRTERGIFFYHFASAALTGLAGLMYALTERSQFGFPGLVLILSVHGIYSLSFLELWTLAQGGYSLSIIENIAGAQATATDPDFSRLEQIGETKQRERIAGLEKLGLITRSDNSIALTRRGSSVAALLHCLLKWIDPGKDDSEAA